MIPFSTPFSPRRFPSLGDYPLLIVLRLCLSLNHLILLDWYLRPPGTLPLSFAPFLSQNLFPRACSLTSGSLTPATDFGKRQETDESGVAWDTMIYSIPEVERITRVAAQIALAVDPPLPIISIDKANVLATSRLWRKTVTELLGKEYPQLKLEHQLVDSAAMIMVSNPRKLNGVVLTENLFGDM